MNGSSSASSSSIIGQRFGRLTVVAPSDLRTSSRNRIYFCRCDCGQMASVPKGSLTRGNTRSCGCLRSERAAQNNRERARRR